MSEGWRLTYTDPLGNSYVLNDNIDAFLERGGLEGFDDADREMASSRAPYRHGVTAHGDPYAPQRVLSAAFDVGAATPAAIKAEVRRRRSAVSPYKKSATPGTLLVEDLDNTVSRSIECWCVRLAEGYKGPSARQLIYHWWAEEAFFYDPTEQETSLAMSGGGGLAFPITFPVTFTSADIDETIVVDNVGDAPTWPTIRIYGPGDNPSFENTTLDKLMALTVSMDAGDYIDIDMEAGTVMMYDATDGSTSSIIETISDASEFWELQVGVNSIEVGVENVGNGTVRFSYYLRYLGI